MTMRKFPIACTAQVTPEALSSELVIAWAKRLAELSKDRSFEDVGRAVAEIYGQDYDKVEWKA